MVGVDVVDGVGDRDERYDPAAFIVLVKLL